MPTARDPNCFWCSDRYIPPSRYTRLGSPQLHEGKVWVRCSVQMMTGFFLFLSYDEIRYALKRLVKGRVLTKGQFNESRFDRTNWYAFTEFGQFLMTESEGRTQ